MPARIRLTAVVLSLLLLLVIVTPLAAQGGPGTKDFPIRDFGACINLPDFTAVTEPDDFNTLYTVPGLFEINFAEYLMPIATLPTNSGEIYNTMIALLNTVSASDYVAIEFNHPQYVSAAVEFTLEGQRMFGMIYRNQNDKLFFLFADKVEDFDMLAIGRAIFAADHNCAPLPGYATTASSNLPQPGIWVFTTNEWLSGNCTNGYQLTERVPENSYAVYIENMSNGEGFLMDSVPFLWNVADNYYASDMSSYMDDRMVLDLADLQGVEIRLRVQSPTVMTGELVFWIIVDEVECNAGTPVTVTHH